jgi:hypothetical protein
MGKSAGFALRSFQICASRRSLALSAPERTQSGVAATLDTAVAPDAGWTAESEEAVHPDRRIAIKAILLLRFTFMAYRRLVVET